MSTIDATPRTRLAAGPCAARGKDELGEGRIASAGPSTEGWQSRARCIGRFDLFFEAEGETPTERRRRETVARAMCDACPVMWECRGAARRDLEHGFWGGETEEERTLAGHMPRSSGRRAVLAARRQARQLQDGETQNKKGHDRRSA